MKTSEHTTDSATKHPDPAVTERAQGALGQARAFRRMGMVDEANQWYDEAFMLIALNFGETHPNTLAVQQEYGGYLSCINILEAQRQRRMN